MSLRRIVLLSFPLLTMAAVACFSDPVFPGDQTLGTFRFEATIISNDCPRDGIGSVVGDAGTLRFEGTFSRNADGGTGWFTLRDFSRGAEYTGQQVRSTHSSPTTLPGCGANCEGSQIKETLDVTLLSSSQDELVGRRCAGLGDGGVLADGGAQPPGPTPNGYDVQRACGTLKDEFLPGTKNCLCVKPCEAVYSVEGIRAN